MIVRLLFLLSVSSVANAHNYLYPIASIDGGEKLLVMHQKSNANMQLLMYDLFSQEYVPALYSAYNPISVTLLPHELGFSFVDNGVMKIKYFTKRSPKSLEFSEPISEVNYVNWIDDDRCYCSAKKGYYSGIFELDTEGMVVCLLWCNDVDYIYPQKIGNSLFYIERVKESLNSYYYRVMECAYEREEEGAMCSSQTVFDSGTQPIAFLYMISEGEGFILEHPNFINDDDELVAFSYSRILRDEENRGGCWHKTSLFTFHVLTQLLKSTSSGCLCESIIPLLPRHNNENIFYVDAIASSRGDHNLNVFQYDLVTNTIMQKTFLSGMHEHMFASLVIGSTVYMGGTSSFDLEGMGGLINFRICNS